MDTFEPKYRFPELEKWCGLISYSPKVHGNSGTLFRTAAAFGGINFLGTIGEKHHKPHSDVCHSWRQIPCFHFLDDDAFFDSKPMASHVVGIELTENASDIRNFQFHDRTIFALGNETCGLPQKFMNRCNNIIKLPSRMGLNASIAGGIVLWEFLKQKGLLAQ